VAVLLGSDIPGVAQAGPASPSMLRSGVSSLALSFLGVVLGFVSVPVMVAGLGYADYGAYTIAFTVAGYGAFLDLGFGWAGMRYAADAHARCDRDAVAGILRALVLYEVVIGCGVAGLLVAGAGPLSRWLTGAQGSDAARIAAVLPIAGGWFALAGINGILVGVLRGVDRHRAAAIVAGTALLLGVGGGALVVSWGHGLRAAALCQVLGALAASAMGLVTLRDLLGTSSHAPGLAAAGRQLRGMLGFSLWTFVSRLVQVVMLQGDKVMAARVAGVAGLPAYVVPFGVAQKLNFLGAAAVTAVVPAAAARSRSRADFLESYFRTARIVHLCTAAPAIAVLVWAPLLLHSWVGAELAASGAGFLRALALGYWIMSVASVEAGCLEGWGHPRITALAAAGSLAVAGIVFVALALDGERLWAVAGAVTAWMVTSGVVTVIAWYRVSGFPPARLWHELVRPVGEMVLIGVATGALAGGWLVPGPWGLLAGAGLVALLLVYGFLRLFPGAEARALLGRLVNAAVS
jgi:O-antigen/teichoic acid export membrane protein